MSGTQQLVGAAGLGLIVANTVSTQRADLAPLWSGSGDLSTAHTAARQVAVEVVGVGALVLIAGTSNATATACLCALGALWVLFLINRQAAAAAGPKRGGGGDFGGSFGRPRSSGGGDFGGSF